MVWIPKVRPVNFYGSDTGELAEYFTENLRDNDLNRSSRKLWGLYFTDKQQEPGEWSPDINRIFKAQTSDQHSYEWEELADDFEAFLEERIDEIEAERYTEEIEESLNRRKPLTPGEDLTEERVYNLGYVDAGLDAEPPQNASDVFMTSVTCFYDESDAESYAASVEYLGPEEGLDAIDFLLDRRPEPVADLTIKGFRRGQTEKALKAYRQILENDDIVMAKNILDEISDEKAAAQARSMLVETSPSYFEGLKDIFDT